MLLKFMLFKKLLRVNIVGSFIIIFILSEISWGWGKRGHETVGSLAAQLLAKEHTGSEFLLNHTYDMGFYNNAPDLVWKADSETYKKESVQHFMDMEDFEKIKGLKWNKNRNSFFKKYPQIEKKSGRSFWRIQELYEKLEIITTQLKKKIKDPKEQHRLQAEWLVHAGTMGHYVADLAQPLHVSENYDGQLTEQKGIHHWFEETMIDHLYPDLHQEVYSRAKSQWVKFHKDNKSKTPFDLALQLSKNSQANIDTLLKLDKKLGRMTPSKIALEYKELAIDRLTAGVLYLAEIWSRQTSWSYNGERFYDFVVAPKYILPEPETKN